MTISDEAVEAAKDAMQEITPPPGMTVEEWVARYGEYAWLAGCIAAAAPFIRAEALEEAADHLEEDASQSNYRDHEAVTQAQLDAGEYLRARAAEMRQG